jgi:hypothetical protein
VGTPSPARLKVASSKEDAPPLRRIAIVSLLALWPGNVAAQRTATPDDFLGLTRCESGRVVTRMRPDVRDTLVLAQLEAHEAVHRAQAQAYSTCEAFVGSIRSARQVVDVELPAYCAQWRVAVAQGGDSVEIRQEYAWRIAAQSGAMENRLDVLQRFRAECDVAARVGLSADGW